MADSNDSFDKDDDLSLTFIAQERESVVNTPLPSTQAQQTEEDRIKRGMIREMTIELESARDCGHEESRPPEREPVPSSQRAKLIPPKGSWSFSTKQSTFRPRTRSTSSSNSWRAEGLWTLNLATLRSRERVGYRGCERILPAAGVGARVSA